MRLSRLFVLSLTMVVAIAWLGLSVGASFHFHDHGVVHNDCPWCSAANFQLVQIEPHFDHGVDLGASSTLHTTFETSFVSSPFWETLSPRAPPVS